MILRFLRAPFTTIKGIQVKKKLKFEYKKIASIFKIDAKQIINSQQQMIKQYFKFLSNANYHPLHPLWSIDPQTFVNDNFKYNIVEYTKQLIADRCKTMTPQAQSIIDNFFGFIASIFLKYTKFHKNLPTNQQNLSTSIVSIVTGINQFFFLMTANKKNCLSYCLCMSQFKLANRFIPNEDFLPNYRNSLQMLSNFPKQQFTQQQLATLLSNMRQINVNQAHYQKSLDLVIHFWRMIQSNWIYKSKSRINFIRTLTQLGYYDQQYLQQISKYLRQSQSLQVDQTIQILISLIKFGKITQQNYDKQYKNVILSILSSYKNKKLSLDFFQKTFQQFYQAGLWIPQYWIPFFQIVLHDRQHAIEHYFLFVIHRLLDIQKQKIPQIIIENGKILTSLLANYTKDQMLKDFYKKQVGCRSISCQTQLANALRIINVGSVRTQSLIDFFFVDILINDKYVVQVNGTTHFLYNMKTKKKQNNLKTIFRSKILKKLGYYLIQVDLQEFCQSSFNLVQQVYDMIKKKYTQDQDLKLIP